MKSSENQSDNSSYDINFLTGINWLLVSNYGEAIHFFLTAIVETDPEDVYYPVYQSYAGLSAVMMRQPGGLQHCRHVADLTSQRHPEVQLNLACAEFFSNDRIRSIQAFDNIDDERLSPESAEEIHAFFDMVGKREKNANGSLKREMFIHKFIGKFFRTKMVSLETIETFIRETAKKRYKSVLNDLQRDLKNQLKKQLEKDKHGKQQK